jgi:phosphoglycerate dehydrogenase-like enzyme
VRVAILDDIHNAYGGSPGVRRLCERAEVRIFTSPFGDPVALRGFDALVANRERTHFTRELLAQLPDVRIIVQTGNHAYHIDLAAARERGITVARASAGYSVGAAELTIGLAIAVMRQIPALDASIRRGEWHTPSTYVLHGKVLGVIGLGRIGRHVAMLATAFGMRVIAWSPHLTDVAAKEVGAERRELDALLAEADVVTVHASLTPDSRGLLDDRRLRLMKPSAYLINTSRGAILNEAALVLALSERRIAGAGLDVFDREPLPPSHPLSALPNVVLTPHIGWPTDEGYARFAEAACNVLLAWVDGQPVPQFEAQATHN